MGGGRYCFQVLLQQSSRRPPPRPARRAASPARAGSGSANQMAWPVPCAVVAAVRFTVEHRFAVVPEAVWQAMVDWDRHADWIPATRVRVDPGDPQAVGATFTAWTGVGPLSLEDRMRVTALDWDTDARRGRCEVAKLGPVLRGRAGFGVQTDGAGARLVWFEDVTVPLVPGLLSPIVTRLSAAGFSHGMRRLARQLEA